MMSLVSTQNVSSCCCCSHMFSRLFTSRRLTWWTRRTSSRRRSWTCGRGSCGTSSAAAWCCCAPSADDGRRSSGSAAGGSLTLKKTTKFPYSLFRKNRFRLDEKFQQNASKFAVFYIYENPKLLFLFFISCYFTFSLLNAPLFYVNIDKGIH